MSLARKIFHSWAIDRARVHMHGSYGDRGNIGLEEMKIVHEVRRFLGLENYC